MSRIAPALLVLLAACGPSDTDPGPGGITADEARALDEAAEMLDAQRLRPEDVTTPVEGAEPEPTA